MKCKVCGSFVNPIWKACVVCDEPIGFDGLESAGLSKNWRDYLLERVEILVDHEGYSGEEARDEVLAMVPYYQELN